MSLLKNAIDSIQVGVEDYSLGEDRRNLSAVRNISSGLLLLYKEKLCQLSPVHDKELLIKRDIRPYQNNDGDLYFEGKGNKTVDVQEIKERFSSLGIKVDWVRFDAINKLRNDIEHYYTNLTPAALREIIAKSFSLIRSFISEELNEDPAALIGHDCWSVLLDVAEIYEAESSACKESLSKIDWVYGTVENAKAEIRCPTCHSALIKCNDDNPIYPNINLLCSSCGNTFNFENILEQCIDDHLGWRAHVAIKDGGESPYDRCPECNKKTFIHEEKCCVSCSYKMESNFCDICEEPIGLEEQFEGRCGYCQYKYEKMMAE